MFRFLGLGLVLFVSTAQAEVVFSAKENCEWVSDAWYQGCKSSSVGLPIGEMADTAHPLLGLLTVELTWSWMKNCTTNEVFPSGIDVKGPGGQVVYINPINGLTQEDKSLLLPMGRYTLRGITKNRSFPMVDSDCIFEVKSPVIKFSKGGISLILNHVSDKIKLSRTLRKLQGEVFGGASTEKLISGLDLAMKTVDQEIENLQMDLDLAVDADKEALQVRLDDLKMGKKSLEEAKSLITVECSVSGTANCTAAMNKVSNILDSEVGFAKDDLAEIAEYLSTESDRLAKEGDKLAEILKNIADKAKEASDEDAG